MLRFGEGDQAAKPVTVQTCVLDGCLVLTIEDSEVRGDQQAESLRKQFLEALKQTGCHEVILDLRNVTFLTSTAFRPLLSLRKELHNLSGRLILCNLNPMVAEVFRVTRLISTAGSRDAPFEYATDLAAALQAMGSN